MLIMPMGPGTYGSQKGRPKKKPTGQLKKYEKCLLKYKKELWRVMKGKKKDR